MSTWFGSSLDARLVSFTVVVAAAVCVISIVAVSLSQFFTRRPATRHSVLLSALAVVIACPLLASLFVLSDLAIFRISVPWKTFSAAAQQPQQQPTDSIRELRDSIPASNQPQTAAGETSRAVTPEAGEPRDDSEFPRDALREVPARKLGELPVAKHALSWTNVWPISLLAVWLVGSAVLLLRLWRSAWRLRHVRKTSWPDPSGTIRGVLPQIPTAARLMDVGRLPRVAVSPRVPGPMAMGIFQPTILLPDTMVEAISHDQLRDVLSHELAHLRRRDPLVVWVQELTQALFWPLPPLHLLNRHLTRAREEVCDNHVLTGRDAVSYGETLFALAALSRAPRRTLATVGILCWRGKLEQRIAGLLDPRRDKMTGTRRAVVLCSIALFGVTAALICGAQIQTVRAEQKPADTAQPVTKNPPHRPASSDVVETSVGSLADQSEAEQAVDAMLRRLREGNRGGPFGGSPRRAVRNESGQTTALKLAGTNLRADEFALLGRLAHLVSLDLSRTNVKDDDLKACGKLQNLRELNLWTTKIRGAGLQHLAGCTALERLDLGDTQIKDDALRHLQALPALRHLALQRNDISDAALPHLADLTQLETLKLCEAHVTDQGLRHLQQLDSLRSVTLAETKVTEVGLKYLAEFPGLAWLSQPESVAEEFARRLEQSDQDGVKGMLSISLSGAFPTQGRFELIEVQPVPPTDRDRELGRQRFYVKMFWEMDNNRPSETLLITFAVEQGAVVLHEIGMSGTNVPVTKKETEAFFSRVVKTPWPAALRQSEPLDRIQRDAQGAVTSLLLQGVRFGHRDITVLAAMQQLTELELSHTNVHSLNLEELVALTNLRELRLDHTRVADKGVPYLAAMPRLQILSLKEVRVTPAGMDQLKSAKPDLKCEYSQRVEETK